MKIAVCSDLHLEFEPLELTNDSGVDVLILSGDICVARDVMEYEPKSGMDFGKSSRYHKFFQECSERFPHVIYVMGNHEHYHGDFAHTVSDLKKRLGYLENLHILDREVFEIDDTIFVGGTLWTNMNKEDPLTMHAMTRMLNDFRCVDNSNHEITYKTFDDPENPDKPTFRTRSARFTPQDAVEEHKKMLQYIHMVYTGMPPWKRMIVVGHHTPSHASCHPRYKNDDIMNGGYHSDLNEFILDRPGIKVWTHGHTHELFDYMIGSTRVVCNPRGYAGHEDIADHFKLKVVEL
jgi:predicted phosphodiesterase